MDCEKCGYPGTVDVVPSHICTPKMAYALKLIQKLEERIRKLEHLNDSVHPGWD